MADSKLKDLTAVGTPVLTDLLYLLADPGGSPLDRKMTLTQLQTLISGLVKIEELTPTGTNATFSSLGAYTHLRIAYSARGDQVATSTLLNLTFNGDTGANYDRQQVNGAATTTASAEVLAGTSAGVGVVSAASAAAGQVGVGEIVIFDYRGTTFQKHAQATGNYKTGTASGGFNVRTTAIAWRDTSAITSIALTLASGNFVSGSKFTLYGMR